MIKIVDYGMGNLRSVQKAFEKLGVAAEICSEAGRLLDAEKLVLPGVGAFRDAMAELARRKMIQPVLEHLAAERPFLGICLGLQLLFEVSYEEGEWEGLGVIPGKVVRFEDRPASRVDSATTSDLLYRPAPASAAAGTTPERGADLKVPHMGWNRLETVGQPRLLEDIPPDAHFYFVHSYYVVPGDESVIAARTRHGVRFVSMVARGNLFATQFHPEKSQRVGLKLLENFAALK